MTGNITFVFPEEGQIREVHAERDRYKALYEELADLWKQEKALQLDPHPGLSTWLEAKDKLHVKVDLALAKLRDEQLSKTWSSE